MQIQEYDLEIVHIKGTANFLADLLSRNPVGLTGEQVENISRPTEIMVSKINLDLHPTVKRDLKNLCAYQTQDHLIETLTQRLAQDAPLVSFYKVENGILYCKDKIRRYWRPTCQAAWKPK
jgi:hypothetical protein